MHCLCQHIKRELKTNTCTCIITSIHVGVGCKPIWYIGIGVIFYGTLGYCLFEIGIMGYPCGIWDTGLMINRHSISSGAYRPTELGYQTSGIGILVL